MKVNFNKNAGGVLSPASDIDCDKMSKFKTGGCYEVEIKQSRNPSFHRKVFSFFNFCFEYWNGGNDNLCGTGQFNVFRENLTVLAGYYNEFYTIKGTVRVEAKSLSYGNMEQDEFERLYSALINAALKNIFKGCDKSVENKLLGFF